MKPETRLLRVVHPDNGGPRPRAVDALIDAGELVKFGERRGATYGLPRALAKQPQAQIGRPRAGAAKRAGRAA